MMSVHTLCDSCDRIIYPSEFQHASIEGKVTSRYGDRSARGFRYDLCEACDIRVAKALKKVLPKLAYALNPNAEVDDAS